MSVNPWFSLNLLILRRQSFDSVMYQGFVQPTLVEKMQTTHKILVSILLLLKALSRFSIPDTSIKLSLMFLKCIQGLLLNILLGVCQTPLSNNGETDFELLTNIYVMFFEQLFASLLFELIGFHFSFTKYPQQLYGIAPSVRL